MISIITPCYNAAAYISETIDSVIRQTYQEWEMIIIDDYSTDDSEVIIKKYAAMDNRIHYYKTEKPSGSPALPRNLGIEKSKGDYIAFLDSDDIWLPTKLEEQIRFINDSKAEMVYSNYKRFKDKNKPGGEIKSPCTASYNDIIKTDYIPLLTLIIKKAILEKVRFKNTFQEDYVLLLDILRTGTIAYNSGACLSLYRISEQSRSSNKLFLFCRHYQILKKENLNFFKICYCMLYYCLAALIKYGK